MPRDLFGDVSDPSVRVGGRKWYIVPLSLAAHTVAVVLTIAMPLMAADILPVPFSRGSSWLATPVQVPSPPPVRRLVPTTPRADPGAAPVEAPDHVAPEAGFEAGFESGAERGTALFDDAMVEGPTAIAPPPPLPASEPQKPVRPGGAIRTPVKIRDAAPVYPPVALMARVEGVVILEAVIAVDGRVQDVRVLRSQPLLDQAAMAAVREWVYTPTTLNGVPVPVIMTVTVRFSLK